MKRFALDVKHIVPQPIPNSPSSEAVLDSDRKSLVEEELEDLRLRIEELSEEVRNANVI